MLIIFIWFRNWKFPTMRTLLTWTHLESSRWAGGMDTGTAWRSRSEIWTLSTFHLFQMRGSEYGGWTLNSWHNLSHLMPWLECKVTLGHDDVSKHGWMLLFIYRHPNFFNNDNFRLHESIMTTSDYHSSSPLTGQPNNTNNQHHQHNGNNSGSGSSSATLGRNQHHKQRCQLHQHHSSASSCLSPSQQQQVASIQSQGAMKRLTFDLLHSLSPGLQRHYVESGGKAEGHQSPYLGPKFN